MISDNVKNNDTLQLQQIIIFLKAELAKYKHEVRKYQEGYLQSLIENLEHDNVQLIEEKNELAEELFRLNKELVKRTSDYKERIQFHETQSKKQLMSIDTLQQAKNDLWTTNQQLTDVIKKLKVGLETKQYNDQQAYSLHSKIEEYKTTIEQLEYKIVDHMHDANKHLQSKIDKFATTYQQRNKSDKVKQLLLKELAKKQHTIDKLQQELIDVKAQLDKRAFEISLKKDQPTTSASTPALDPEILSQLDQQIRKILAQSLDYEEQLATKQLVLHTLEQKLDQLTVEVDDIKIFGVSGQIVKES
ncbi:hypothetical protein [Sporosarcina sp. YIM B06819]|uniref:hypothetical protein n=1 Tax=Sporosarcina sp. YIM B06819 TaxID=3081769 RepID=UPI00298C00B9|nr:hypothetical protein [Sporosarcina sp. YIM B06819]